MPHLVETIPTAATSNGLSPSRDSPAVSSDDDRNRNSRRRSSGPRWVGRAARWTVRGWRWISRDPAAWVLLWHGSANSAGYRPGDGGAQCPLGIFAISATLRRRSAHGRGHRRVGFDCDLPDSPFRDLTRPACLPALL